MYPNKFIMYIYDIINITMLIWYYAYYYFLYMFNQIWDFLKYDMCTYFVYIFG